MALVRFRFYAELNDFLAPLQRQRRFAWPCARDASAKHMIEALGVPHTEVELILANDVAVDFSYRLQDGDRLAVYPHFSAFDDVPGALTLPGADRFVADAHLGRLARDLRMLGFDALYDNRYTDAEVTRLAQEEERIVLSRDRDLLIRKSVARGCYLHATATSQQLDEVLLRYRLAGKVRLLSRCLRCNALLQPVDKSEVRQHLPLRSGAWHDDFFICTGCGRIYWNGSHAARMRTWAERLLRKHTGRS